MSRYSAECVTFGMGGGLLQKVNRDTMSFATKLSCIHYADTDDNDNGANTTTTTTNGANNNGGKDNNGAAVKKNRGVHDIMKMPTTDSGKFSLPGVLQVRRVKGVPTVFPAEYTPDLTRGEVDSAENLLQVIYSIFFF